MGATYGQQDPNATSRRDQAARARRTSPLAFARDETEAILRTLGTDVGVFTSEWTDKDRGEGGDIDCLVHDLDPSWPLRLPPDVRLCQMLAYDVHSCYWVLERAGRVLALDTLDDPDGSGRYGYRTDLMLDATGGSLVPPPAVRGAYLTIKRAFKQIEAPEAWDRISSLAKDDLAAYERILASICGASVAADVASAVASGAVPDANLRRRMLRARNRQRRTRPSAWRLPALRVSRLIDRATRPTGLLIAVTGTDGTGKSTLARELAKACSGFFRRDEIVHWRPGVLPRPGGLAGTPAGDPQDPHGRPARGRLLSTLLLTYHWMDFMLGSLIRFYPAKVRSGLIVVERGWWDVLVDPKRYRLNVSPRLVRLLGRTIPQPSLTFVCHAPLQTLSSRKQELTSEEVVRQSEAWRALQQERVSFRLLDTSAPLEQVTERARESVVRYLEDRTIRRAGRGWIAMPGSDRWILPRGPRAAVRYSLDLYQPMSSARRYVWRAARFLASIGVFGGLPRAKPPPRQVRAMVAAYVPRGGHYGVARANHPGRYIVQIADGRGEPTTVVKVALDEPDRAALAHEAAAIEDLSGALVAPLRAPVVEDHGDGVLVLRAETWHPRGKPWMLDPEVARALGSFFASGSTDLVGPTHGDVAPWNLLATDVGYVLIDWESARPDGPAGYDLFHHLVQSHILLGNPSEEDVLAALGDDGPYGEAVSVYRAAAGVEADRIRDLFLTYLQESRATLDPSKADGRKGLEGRERLVERMREQA